MIEPNMPFGFVVRNTKQREEFHFAADSNGWVTGISRVGKHKEGVGAAFNAMGMKVGTLQRVDPEFTKNAQRVLALQECAKKRPLTNEEKDELLERTGIVFPTPDSKR